GEVWSWGQNTFGQLGTGSVSNTPLPQPAKVNGLPPIKAIAAGASHSLALDVDGHVWAWGFNNMGQAGIGTAGGSVLTPTQLATLPTIQAIAANGSFSLALATDGRLWAWGQNTSGQLGTGTTGASVATPVQVPGLPTLRAIAAGVNHTLALDADGRVWAWGFNNMGQVGTGSTSPASVLSPVMLAGLPRAKAIAAGVGHSLIIDEQFGNVWAWGQNTFGQVGTGAAS
ncbi:RCC1 domain-containing protein, partial [Pyxidicoccus sp. 3LG]